MSEKVNALKPAAPALPATVSDLILQRKSLRTRSLNDDVEECHLKLWDDQSYRDLFLPIWREETIEGSFIADEMVAATKIRSFASRNALPLAANAKLAAIVRSLGVVCRRYQMDRRHRQGIVGTFGSDDVETPKEQAAA